MTIDATLLDADLDDIFNDFESSITVGGSTYAGFYEQTYVEISGFDGYAPVFTGKAADLGGLNKGDGVTVSSDIEGITSKAFTVRQPVTEGRTIKLILHEA